MPLSIRPLLRLDQLDRRILAIAIPALGSLLVEPIYVLTDTAVVGRVGTSLLAGLALASTILTTLVWVFNFLSYGTTVRVAVRRGRGDHVGGATDALQALWLALLIGTVMAVSIATLASPLVQLIGSDPAVLSAATTYLRISAVGIPFQFLMVASIGYLYGIPNTTRPFLVALGGNVVNLVIELVLVFGFELGIAGSAWGTVIAQVLAALTLLTMVVPMLRRDGLTGLRFDPKVMWAILKVGGHLIQRTAFLLAALALATAAASRVGTVALAAHQIAAQLFLMLAIGVDMFKVAGQSLVGNALGAGDTATARDVVTHMYRWAARAGVLLTAVLLAVSPWIAGVFSNDGQVRSSARVALLILAAMQLPAALTFVLDGVLMGANDFRSLRWQTTLAFAAAAPFLIAVRLQPSLGLGTIWFGLLVWISVRAWRNHARVDGDEWMLSADLVR